MDVTVYIEGIGWCEEVTINKTNADGVNEPYVIYEPL